MSLHDDFTKCVQLFCCSWRSVRWYIGSPQIQKAAMAMTNGRAVSGWLIAGRTDGRPADSNTSLCSPAVKMNHKIVKQWVKLTRFVTLKLPEPQWFYVMCQLFECCNKCLWSHRENCAANTTTAQSVLYREVIAVCFQIRTKNINSLCGQNTENAMLRLAVRIAIPRVGERTSLCLKVPRLARSSFW
jgi:hypothetical protein